MKVLFTGLTIASWSLSVTLLISVELIDHLTGTVAVVTREPSSGSMIVIIDHRDPLAITHVIVVPVPDWIVLRRDLPLFFTNNGLCAMLSSIPPTSVVSWSHGLARSDADIIILFPALSVYAPTDVDIATSHLIAYTVLYI